ncbi:MAG: GatB/YqeY domain-containing protein [Candidatus Margulisbacteria bacterium]|nr:GatB/YqeY domain-containing protein [Candidatus Margulisiibacteriota bacterium]
MTNDGKLFAKINDQLKEAMKSRDEIRLSVLRMMKSKILYVNARGDLPDAEVIKIIKKYAKELNESIIEYQKAAREDEVKKIKGELKIVEEFLPQELSKDAIKAIVEKTIKDIGATSIKDMGRVMKELTANPAIDGKLASTMVREILK